jgi:DNA-binding protein H-NS
MKTLQDLLAQKAQLDAEIETTQKREHQEALGKIKSLMQDHGITVADLGNVKNSPKNAVRRGAKVPAKYYNAGTGDEWTGRGLKPKWVRAALDSGKSLSDFLIKK